MREANQTQVTEFLLLGLSDDPHTQKLLFILFLAVYLITVLANLLLMSLVQVDSRLHTPMYFFLCNLSLADLCFSTNIVPQALVHLHSQKKVISFTRCAAQAPALLIVASTDTHTAEMVIFFMGVVILLIPVSLILVSYSHIIVTVVRMKSAVRRLKAFSTCGSHLMVVILFYGSGIVTYMTPKSSKEQEKLVSVFYTMVIPMLNPLIYSLRNKDVKGALRKVATRNFSCRLEIFR
ncbi:olfactory receptor 2D2-like [Suricata suricatta]|uniref:olfactory receptor 2D2-like n=1 Tax=Suricata suricatta TaxID=37032 RepID=UPI00115680A3|nr:olfactory receptor 2D2-like [Suricata suricatta]